MLIPYSVGKSTVSLIIPCPGVACHYSVAAFQVLTLSLAFGSLAMPRGGFLCLLFFFNLHILFFFFTFLTYEENFVSERFHIMLELYTYWKLVFTYLKVSHSFKHESWDVEINNEVSF